MSAPVTDACPNCKKGKLKDNGGTDRHTGIHGAHYAVEGFLHGSPLKLMLGAAGAAMRLLNPRTFTCDKCGHVVKA